VRKVTVNKIEAARVQLERAARLFYIEADTVSAYSLAAAAREILAGLSKSRGGASLRREQFVLEKYREPSAGASRDEEVSCTV